MGRLTTLVGGGTRIVTVPSLLESITSIRIGAKLDVAAFRGAWSFGNIFNVPTKALPKVHVDGDNLYLYLDVNSTNVGGSTPISLASLPANGTDVVFCLQYSAGDLNIAIGFPDGTVIVEQQTNSGGALSTGAGVESVELTGTQVALNLDAYWLATSRVTGDARFALPVPASNVHLLWCVTSANAGTSGQALTLGDGTLTGTGGDWNGSPPPPSINIPRRRRTASGASLL